MSEPSTMGNGSYPISDQHSANSAWKLRGHSTTYSEAQVVAHIRGACKKLGLTFPGGREQSWDSQLEARLRHAYRPKSHPYHAAPGMQLGAPCATCGQPMNDPDHDGDQDGANSADSDDSTFQSNLMADAADGDPGNPDDVGDHDAHDDPTGCMVAFYPPRDVAEKLAVAGGEPVEDLHMTLVFLGEASKVDAGKLKATVEAFAHQTGPVSGMISGHGLFTAGEQPVTYASIDCPALPAARQRLVAQLQAAGLPVATNHGYTPHMTLAYAKKQVNLPNEEVRFDAVWVCVGADRFSYALTGAQQAAVQPKPHPTAVVEKEIIAKNRASRQAQQMHVPQPAQIPQDNGAYLCLLCGEPVPSNGQWCQGVSPGDTNMPPPGGPPAGSSIPVAAGWGTITGNTFTGNMTSTIWPGTMFYTSPVYIDGRWQPATPPFIAADITVPTLRAFVTEASGKTLITAPVGIRSDTNPHFLQLSGRMVGAERPNRNNAFWSSRDLELGNATVANGPLNWLHEARHVVGTLTSSRFVDGQAAAAQNFDQPHIATDAVLWRWLYPQESDVVQMASDVDRLFLSMECISKSVKCAGDTGCGVELSYDDYIANRGACDHLKERSGVRHFQDPIFLGCALILPPARPGWADATASVRQAAAAVAPDTYDQAGKPDISASDWEQLMVEVLAFAQP